MNERVEDFLSQLRPSADKLRALHNGLIAELDRGLQMHKRDPSRWRPAECDLMMLDCCFATLPTGNETGLFYALDFGGTNIRVVRATMDGVHEPVYQQQVKSLRETRVSRELPKGVLDKNATASMLFDAVADIVHDFMEAHGDLTEANSANPLPLGFTFSFGITQNAIDRAMLYQWAKDFETGNNTDDPVIGQDVCALLRAAFQRKNIPLRLIATLNDTTGTMIAAAMKKPKDWPQCAVGMILGTGVNGCYYEPEAENHAYLGRVINTECGGFQHDIPATSVDIEIDFDSQNVGAQRFEKMISGHYIPEVARRTCLKIFQHNAPRKMWTPYSLSCEESGRIYSDPVLCDSIVKKVWDVEMSPEELNIVKRAIDAAWDRSAALAAVLIATLCKKTGRLTPAQGGVTVGVDGSVYTKNPKYQTAVRSYLKEILGEDLAAIVYIQLSDDGSGKGAACLAATLASPSATAGAECEAGVKPKFSGSLFAGCCSELATATD